MRRCAACGDAHAPEVATCPRVHVSVNDGPCGTRIERYDVERLLGGGGFGAVYLARHAMLGHAVALKLLRREVATHGDVVARFLREARAAASIDSPNVVRVADFGTTDDGVAFFVMELVGGRDLDALLANERVLPIPRAVEIALQTLRALAAAHAAGVVHRDVKPANIVLAAEKGRGAERDHVKVVDFGLSKVALAGGATQLTMTGAILGTPHYMPREQFEEARAVDARADLYAVGVILYRMLSGALPYDAPTFEQLLVKICSEPPRPLRDVAPALPSDLVDIVARAIAREPDDRFPTAEAFIEALSRVGQPTVASRPKRGRAVLFALLGGVSLVALLLGAWIVSSFVRPEETTSMVTGDRSAAVAPAAVAPVALPRAVTEHGGPYPGPDTDADPDLPPPTAEPDIVVRMVPMSEHLPRGVDFGPLMGLPPGTDFDELPGMEVYGRDLATADLPRIGASPPYIAEGQIQGSARIDATRVVASLRAALARLAPCAAPAGSARVEVTLQQLFGRTATLSVDGPNDQETLQCVRAVFDGVDLTPNVPADTMAIVHVVIELPTR